MNINVDTIEIDLSAFKENIDEGIDFNLERDHKEDLRVLDDELTSEGYEEVTDDDLDEFYDGDNLTKLDLLLSDLSLFSTTPFVLTISSSTIQESFILSGHSHLYSI